MAQFAPRLGAIWTPGGDGNTSIRAALGRVLRHAAPVLQHALRQQPALGRADHAVESRRAGWADPYSTYPGGNPFPALNNDWATAVPAVGVYVNAPIDIKPTSLQQWNVSAQRQVGDWMLSASYLGNKSTHLWRATELNPAVFGAGATTGNTNQRRRLILQNPVEGQFYGTIGHVDDTGRGIYHGLLLSAQRRLKNNSAC